MSRVESLAESKMSRRIFFLEAALVRRVVPLIYTSHLDEQRSEMGIFDAACVPFDAKDDEELKLESNVVVTVFNITAAEAVRRSR